MGKSYHKSMFGGFGVYRAGQIFAIVVEDLLYFKVDDTTRPDYESTLELCFLKAYS
jgi:DNA transformation protein